jgi:F0F1-type ATP synthase membrane subunit b/b'
MEGPVAAAEQQLMDLDGTVFVMLGLFLVLLAILTSVYWKPYLRVRGERVTRVDGYREQAAQMEDETRTRLETIERELAEARRQGAGAMAMARTEAHTREQTILAGAHAKAQAALSDARTQLERALATQRAALQQRSQDLGREAASRILGRELS